MKELTFIQYLMKRNRLFDTGKKAVGFTRLQVNQTLTKFDIENHEHHDRYMRESKDL